MVRLHIPSRVPAAAIDRQHDQDKGVPDRNRGWRVNKNFPQRCVNTTTIKFPFLNLSTEYYEARKSLGDISVTEGIYDAMYRSPFGGGLRSLLQRISGDAPSLFQIFTISRNPASFSLTAMTLLQSTSSDLHYTIWKLLNARKGFTQSAEAIRDYFDYLRRQGAIVDGTVEFEDAEKIKGMKIEFR